MLKAGSKAPKIDLLDQNGKRTTLASFGKKKVLVYFYPKADTPGCTQQSCLLRDIVGEIGRTAIVGISPDSPAKQKKFDDKYSLGFPLLSDEEHVVAKAFKVWKEKSMYGRKYMGIARTTFVIDEKGIISEVIEKVETAKHAAQILK